MTLSAECCYFRWPPWTSETKWCWTTGNHWTN